MDFSWEAAISAFPKLMKGAVVTLEATILGFALALLIGLGLTALRRSRLSFVGTAAFWVMEVLRSTPLLVKAYFLFFGLPAWGITLEPLTTGIIALGLHHGAFASEAMRAGIESIPRGQWEAAFSLNFPRSALYRRVILPQALRPILPAFGNMMISMMKDTPVLFSISVTEMMFVANEIGALEFRYTEATTLAALIFLTFSLIGGALVRKLERRLQRKGYAA